MQNTSTQPADEITLIEERRKRREAIKARHRGQPTPLIVRSVALPATSVPSTPKLMDVQKDVPAQGTLIANRCLQSLIRAEKCPTLPLKSHQDRDHLQTW